MAAGVYIVVADEFDRFKVGYSSDVERRLDQMQTCCPTKLRVLDVLVGAGFDVEATIHSLLLEYHVIGEWFDVAGLRKARTQFFVVREASRNVAQVIFAHLPRHMRTDMVEKLQQSGANSIAAALANLIGQPVTDKVVHG